MDVILLEKMRNLGALGDKVKVKAGYARNYLVPQGKAVYATQENLGKFEERRAELEKQAALKHKKALAKQQKLADLATISLKAKVGEEGKLFGSIGARDIAAAITAAGVEVEKSEVCLPEGVLRKLGEYDIAIELESDVITTVKLNILPEA